MDNRLRFLYFMISELWGHSHKAESGNGKTGASTGGAWEANPPCKPEVLSVANKRVAKSEEWLSGKAAIVYHEPVP